MAAREMRENQERAYSFVFDKVGTYAREIWKRKLVEVRL